VFWAVAEAGVETVNLAGVPFLVLGPHDGRFVHAAGVFAFARRDGDGSREILHLELAEDVSRVARPTHPTWPAAMAAGMNELLVHLAGREARAGELEPAMLMALAAELDRELPPERRAG